MTSLAVRRPPRRRPGPWHVVFGLLLLAGVAARVLVTLAYRSSFEFFDSFAYLHFSRHWVPNREKPNGYPFVLHLVWLVDHDLVAVAVFQHVLALVTAVLVYVLLRRNGVHPGLACLATLPLLLDLYEVDLEHFVMPETVFVFLAVVAFALLSWNRRPSTAAVALAGFAAGYATLVRLVGAVVVVGVLGLVLGRRLGARRVAACALGAALPLVGYAAWFHAWYGHYGLDSFGGRALYGKVAPFADCRGAAIPASEHVLCETTPDASRPPAPFYLFRPGAPIRRLDGLPYSVVSRRAGDFARRIVEHQPATYLHVVGDDLLHYVSAGRHVGGHDWPYPSWRLPLRSGTAGVTVAGRRYGSPFPTDAVVHPGVARALRGVQRWAYLPGPVGALGAVLGIFTGLLRRWRDERGPGAVLVGGMTALGMLVVPAATVAFDYRYTLPAGVLEVLAGCWAVHLLARPGRG